MWDICKLKKRLCLERYVSIKVCKTSLRRCSKFRVGNLAKFILNHNLSQPRFKCMCIPFQTFKAITRGQEYEGKVPNTVYLHTYLAYLRQTNTVQRNLLMIESLKENLQGQRTDESKKITKPQDLARLYDIIIQV